MNHYKRIVAIAGALLMSVGGWVYADGDRPDLQEEVATLKARLAELEARQNQSWLNTRRSEEVKALIHEVLADADSRASLLSDGAMAGHDGKGFFLSAPDGSFLLRFGGQFQVRYMYNSRETSATPMAGFDEEEFGFQLRRVKLLFSGHIGSPRITYAVGLQTDRDTETVQLDHGFIGYRVADNVTVYAGESKAPFLREETTSSSRQLAVERSLMNEVFTAGRIQGIWAVVDTDDHTRLTVAFTDGANSGEAGGTKDFHNDAADYAFTARVDLRLAGEWAQMKDFSAWSGEQQAVFVGAAVHYEIGETGDGQTSASLPGTLPAPSTPHPLNPFGPAVGYDDFLAWTIDGSIESNGLGIFAAVTGLHINAVNGANDIDAYGLMVQAGVFVIPNRLEPFARWEWIEADTSHDVNVLTFGANYYLTGHDAKFTADLVWALNSLDNLNSSGLGLLADNTGEADQVALRAQFQLLF